MSKRDLYEVNGETLLRKSKFCPRCGEGVFMAEHKNRFSCGSCGYTEWKEKKVEEKPAKKPAEKSVEKPAEKPKKEK